MSKNIQSAIKVDNTIKPLAPSKRIQPVLNIGHTYYVSFYNNKVYPCALLEIINEFDETEVKIKITLNPKSKKAVVDCNGNRSYTTTQTNTLRAIEIGLTPEDAVRNQAF